MTEQAGLEVETLTIRIPIRLQRRGGRKLIMTPEGGSVPTPKPRRDETLIKALVKSHHWRRKIESGKVKSITDRQRAWRTPSLPSSPAYLPRARHPGSDPRRAAAEALEACRDADAPV